MLSQTSLYYMLQRCLLKLACYKNTPLLAVSVVCQWQAHSVSQDLLAFSVISELTKLN